MLVPECPWDGHRHLNVSTVTFKNYYLFTSKTYDAFDTVFKSPRTLFLGYILSRYFFFYFLNVIWFKDCVSGLNKNIMS